MSFEINGEFIETCSCNMLCPCWYGVPELMVMDRGWCATTLLVRIESGQSNGVDLSGLNVPIGLFFPGPTLVDGGGIGRVYIDDRASAEQQQELENIFEAKVSGPMEVPASLLSEWLPAKRVRVDVEANNGDIHARVEGLGEIVSKRLENELGDRVTMRNAAFMLAFQFTDAAGELAPSAGTSWRDDDMPESWENQSGMVGQIAWRN